MNKIDVVNYHEEYHETKPSLFRESENIDRVLQAIFDVCDYQQEDFLWLSQNLLNLDEAEGFHLDLIGGLVGQPRFLSDFNTEPYFGYEGSYQSKPFSSVTNPDIGGFWNSRSYFNTATARQLNDEEYRRLIKARAIYNQSNCTANDLLEVVNLITDSDDNTVQLLKHGLVQIKTSDKTGILSYFVDRLYLEDNILPIAAGVRVGLEQSASDGSGGGIPDTDWEVKKVYEGSTGSKVGIDAVRTKNSSEVETSIEVTPTAGQISDRIKSGEYGAEVNKAVLDIDPDATDWVLDPANNRVNYEIVSGIGSSSTAGYSWAVDNVAPYIKLASASAVADELERRGRSGTDFVSGRRVYFKRNSDSSYTLALEVVRTGGTYNAFYDITRVGDPSQTITSSGNVKKSIPIPTVSTKVISNAEAGHEESKSLLVSVVSVLASMKFYDTQF